MNQIQIVRRIIQQMRTVLPIAERHVRPVIKLIFFGQQLCLALMLEQRRLEAAIDCKFDPVINRKLVAIQVLLEK